MTRKYETFKKGGHETMPILRSEYQMCYDAVAKLRKRIQLKTPAFDSLAAVIPSLVGATRPQIKAEKAKVRRSIILFEAALQKQERVLQELLRTESNNEQEFPAGQAHEHEINQMVAKINQEIEQARQSLKAITSAINLEQDAPASLKLESPRKRLVNSGASQEVDTPLTKLSKPPKLMMPRLTERTRLTKQGSPARAKLPETSKSINSKPIMR